MLINKRYLAIPYNNNMALKSMEFYSGDVLVYDLNVKIDCYTPEFYAYLDVSRFMGQELNILCRTSENVFKIKNKEVISSDENDKFYITQTDDIPHLNEYENRYRPHIHFTANRGWLSDPNGLVFANGVYHLFYQHNPVSNEWENMHWGHAVSKDLIMWEHKPVALAPDELGTIFSGCGITIENKLIFFYTAAGSTSKLSAGKSFTICKVISTDNGETFQKSKNNPLVLNITKMNRDPKVVYCKQVQAYIMALYLENSKYALLLSKDLSKWRVLQTFELSGDSECPDLYPLYLDDDPNKEYWIFSGASDKYYVGKFECNGENDEDIRFVSSQPVKTLHYGSCSYAPQTFYGTKKNEVSRLSWLQGNIPLSPFNGQLSIPMQMKLKTLENEMFLCAKPIEDIKKYYKNTQSFSNVNLTTDIPFIQTAGHYAADILIETEYDNDNVMIIQIFGVKIICDMTKNQVKCGNSVSPITIKQKRVKMRMIIDKNSVELFMDEGEFYMSCSIICDYHLDNLKITSLYNMQLNRIKIASVGLK